MGSPAQISEGEGLGQRDRERERVRESGKFEVLNRRASETSGQHLVIYKDVGCCTQMERSCKRYNWATWLSSEAVTIGCPSIVTWCGFHT